MDSHYSNPAYSYGDGAASSSHYQAYAQHAPSSFASHPNLRGQYEQQQQQPQQQQQQQPQQPQQGQQTLPPLHPQQRSSASSTSLYDHYHNQRSHQGSGYPSAAASQLTSGYSSSSPFGGSFANYSHDSLMPQQPQGYGMHQDSGAPTYMNDMRSSAFGGMGGQTLPPLPSTQPYNGPFPGSYDQPSHVVGAQGRRGILPSDDGRPPAVASDGSAAARTNVMPVKDQDGKFPCPHCNKTYLHAKHLKRHLLRHTGDRPYSCFLCNDTFSRSDILKRHFQKCSIRRGNPTGASHLQNSQSHLRKQAAKRTSNELSGKAGTQDGTKSGADSETNSLYSASTSRPASDNFSSLRSDGRTDSSISTMSTPVREKARSMTGPQPLSSIKAEQVSSQPVTPALPSSSTAMSEAHFSTNDITSPSSSIAPSYRDSNVLGSIQSHHTSHDFEWSNMHAQQNQIDFINPYFNALSSESDLLGADQNYQLQFPHANAVSYAGVCTRMLSYLQLSAYQDLDSQLVKVLLTAENVEEFLTKYLHFNQHWPNVHMPSFDPMTCHPALSLAMFTTGAVYAEHVSLEHSRMLLRGIKTQVYNVSEVGRAAQDPSMDVTHLIQNPESAEQVAALGILSTLALWHSEPDQRETLTGDLRDICQVTKRLGMLEALPRSIAGASELHQPDAQVGSVNAASFDYAAWLRQEKRSRALYAVWLTDIAQCLFFNVAPNYGTEEVKIPLPADDAAWDAQDANECAVALGLQGAEAQDALNVAGSRRTKQVELHLAVKVLAHRAHGFQSRSTNAYGKFITIHAILGQIWHAQHQQRTLNGDFFGVLPTVSHNTAPLSPADWVTNNGSVQAGSIPGSGYGTPISENGLSASTIHALDSQLVKWRKSWDEDESLQYPPHSTQPLYGFCRDCKPFFWLGKWLLKHMHQLDPNAEWRSRFATMVLAIKQSKQASANESNGLGLSTAPSAVIDSRYGMDDLTVDMKLFFTPMMSADSPSVSSGTFAGIA